MFRKSRPQPVVEQMSTSDMDHLIMKSADSIRNLLMLSKDRRDSITFPTTLEEVRFNDIYENTTDFIYGDAVMLKRVRGGGVLSVGFMAETEMVSPV